MEWASGRARWSSSVLPWRVTEVEDSRRTGDGSIGADVALAHAAFQRHTLASASIPKESALCVSSIIASRSCRCLTSSGG